MSDDTGKIPFDLQRILDGLPAAIEDLLASGRECPCPGCLARRTELPAGTFRQRSAAGRN